MIYEMRTYTLKPAAVADFEARFAERQPFREKYSRLGAFWHTEFGTLNQVIHVWPYENLDQRVAAREGMAKDPDLARLPVTEFIVDQEAEILNAAPFMRPMTEQQLGNIYEMRTYTFVQGSMGEVLKRWGESIPHREKYSPLAACWYTDVGGLNRFIHVWPYKDMDERARIRAEALKDPHWPPGTGEFTLKQENKILIPASFSPMK